MSEANNYSYANWTRELQQLTSARQRQNFLETLFANSTEELIPSLLEQLQPRGDELTNWATIRVLATLDVPRSEIIPALINLLKKGRPPSRHVVVEALQKIAKGDQEVINTLTRIESDFDEDLALCIIKALGEIGENNTVARNALIEVIYNRSSYEIRNFAARALAKVDSGTLEAIQVWLYLVQSREDYSIRAFAMRCLGEVAVGNPQVIATFKAMIQTQGNDQWSQETRTIGSIGLQEVNRTPPASRDIEKAMRQGERVYREEFNEYREQKAAQTHPETIDLLLEVLDHGSTEQDVENAIAGLTNLGKGDYRVIRRFLSLLPNYRDTRAYHMIVTGLAKNLINPSETLKDEVAAVLISELQQPQENPLIKTLLAQFLGTIGRSTSDAVQKMIEQVNSRQGEWELAAGSLVALQPLGNEALLNFLSATNDLKLLTAITTSRYLPKAIRQDSKILDAVINLTQRPDPMIAGLGVYALQKLNRRDTQIIQALEEVSQNYSDEEVRQMASDALASLQSPNSN